MGVDYINCTRIIMKLIAAISSIALVAAEDDCCNKRPNVCKSLGQKQCPPDGFRSTCAAFCDTPYDNPRDCSNRGNKNAGIFLPFGSANGDTMGARVDDTAEGPITLRNDVPYFGNHYNNVYFSSNGVISFNQGVSSFTSQAFPISGKTMFSPFWADFNTAIEGTWSYRQLRAGDDLERASRMVNFELDAYSDFVGTDGVVVTYSGVAHFGRSSSSDRTNDMQAILVHDNNHSFAIFQYGDIEWTTVTASQGDRCTGLGGTPAQVGFNDGGGNFYSVPGSQTNDMQHIDDMTNCRTTGRFIFKIDGETVHAAEPVHQDSSSVDISIDEPLTGISQYMAERIPSLASQISSHGCHCSRLQSSVSVGSPVDDLDRICRNWISKRRCILKNGGTCQNDSPFYESFTPSDCSSSASACEQLACDIDDACIGEINAYLAENTNWTANTGAVCVATDTPRKDSCCGTSVATLTTYDSNFYSCENGELNPV